VKNIARQVCTCGGCFFRWCCKRFYFTLKENNFFIVNRSFAAALVARMHCIFNYVLLLVVQKASSFRWIELNHVFEAEKTIWERRKENRAEPLYTCRYASWLWGHVSPQSYPPKKNHDTGPSTMAGQVRPQIPAFVLVKWP
jgi:hypothetical protein